MQDALRWSAYPLTLTAAVGLCAVTVQGAGDGSAVVLTTYAAVIAAGLAVLGLERVIPYRASWRPTTSDVVPDALFMLIVQGILPRLLGFAAVLWLLEWYRASALGTAVAWPTHWGVLPQLVLMLLTADLLRYGLHRLSHSWAPLWRLHAVHHAPRKLYWLNVGRFHPLEKGLQFVFDALPFVLLGVPEAVLALYFVCYAVHGFFQHANVDVRLGWLNYLVSGPELHRWHHSVDRAEAHHNFGNNLIVWDVAFGTFYWPAARAVRAVGTANPHYPTSFGAALWAPFLAGHETTAAPPLRVRDLALNALLGLRMWVVRMTTWRRWLGATRAVEAAQRRVMQRIVAANRTTRFGTERGFTQIASYADFAERVPVSTYDDLAGYLEGANDLTAEAPVLYQVTSGTTGRAKYLPITATGLQAIQRQQNLFALARHDCPPGTYAGKVFAAVSPAVEGHTAAGVPFGATSGLLYQTLPRLARRKYVVPYPVFEIDDYDVRYRTLALLAAANPTTTAAGAANPSTFVRLLEVLNEHRDEILAAIASGGASIDWLDGRQRQVVGACLAPDAALAARLRTRTTLAYRDIWPHLKMLTTWTGGSCGVALSTLAPTLPADAAVVEMGYLASEFRGTITVGRAAGVPTLTDHFFEFARPAEWDAGQRRCLRLHELTVGEHYYVIVTTPNGLYRYFINDIVQVDGTYNDCPTLRFVQKGRGVTNITGEKLCEYQVAEALRAFEARTETPVRFYQVLADAQAARYRVYVEADLDPAQACAHGRTLDALLAEANVEYAQKRCSGRLRAPRFAVLANGTAEAYKRARLGAGQREGQFKTVALMDLGAAEFPFEAHVR